MAFRPAHHRPPVRQLSFQASSPPPEVSAPSAAQRKRPLEESEEWVLFSPGAPSTTCRTQTTSTERTPRTAGLSHLSDFGSLDTAARSREDDDITNEGTEEGEELDSLDDGLHAFHEPSEYGAPTHRLQHGGLQESGDTVLPTHDGLGAFQPDAMMQDHLWQFERQAPRRRHVRRRSSVQRRLDALEETEEATQERDRRQRIEDWRLEQSRALLEEIEKETRRRRRMSMASAARSADTAQKGQQSTTSARPPQAVSPAQSVSSDEGTENLSFWERLTRRVIRDLMGIDEDTLSVIFGESLPQEPPSTPQEDLHATVALDMSSSEPWESRLLERVARELGILVHQLSEHPGAFSTYLRTQESPEYAGQTTTKVAAITTNTTPLSASQTSPTAAFAPTFPTQQPSYSEASLWGIEEEPEVDPLDSFRNPVPHAVNAAEEMARERDYWERELDVKMVFNFLVKRFSSRPPGISSQQRSRSTSIPTRHQSASSTGLTSHETESAARRAAIIRQHHPLVGNRTAMDRLPTSSSSSSKPMFRYQQAVNASASATRNQAQRRSSESCASQSTRKSKRSAGSGRHYWDMSGSVGSGSVLAAEV